MKILVLLGSPRRKGNSEAAAAAVVEEFTGRLGGEVQWVRLATQKAAPCIACGGCEKTGECVVEDGMTELYPLVDAADLIILAGPTYFYGLSAQLKGFIDRIQARWSRKYLLKARFRRDERRRGCLICTAATRGKRLFDGSELVARSFFDAIDVDYGGALVIRGVDERGAFSSNAEEVDRARAFAREIAGHFGG